MRLLRIILEPIETEFPQFELVDKNSLYYDEFVLISSEIVVLISSEIVVSMIGVITYDHKTIIDVYSHTRSHKLALNITTFNLHDFNSVDDILKLIRETLVKESKPCKF